MIAKLMQAMIAYDYADPKRIQHFTKVHDYARMIGILEGLDEHTLYILETAAMVHDIGIRLCEEKYGSCEGSLQEKEGPALATEMLQRLGYEEEVIQRVAFLVGHHHTYTGIDGPDYQILVEADFLVNLYEDGVPETAVEAAYEKIFRTRSGRQFCRDMFGLQMPD